MTVRLITPDETHALRHLVLRPHQALADCDYPGDRDPHSFHVGVFEQDQLISIGTFHKVPEPKLPGTDQYRLRGMATHPDHRSKGVGTQLMQFAIEQLITQKADVLWCHARINAIAFYKRLGLAIEGPQFNVPGIGEHYLMYRKLP
jgi:ribosomal protein S18 acetylase RimI-like enzyme